MYPEIFGIIKSYGLMLALSFALGMWLSVRRGRKYNLEADVILDLVFGVLVSSIVGVRLFYVLTHLGDFSPWYRALYIWDGGLTLYGGIILATATVWYMCRRKGVPFLVIADIFSPGVVLGIGLTRIGCLLAGCCFGTPSDHTCAITFPATAPASLEFGQVSVLPSQIFGSGGGFAVFGLLLLLERWTRFRGATFGWFLVLYSISRFLVDLSRHYEPDQLISGLSNNQWISFVLLILGVVVLVTCRRAARMDVSDV